MKKILSIFGLVLASSVYARVEVPCFVPGAYFGLGLGVSTSYNRLSAKGGPDVWNKGMLPANADDLNVPTDPGNYYIFGIDNIAPGGYGGPGTAILPELGYTYIVPKSSFAMGIYVNGGIAQSRQHAAVPVKTIIGAPSGIVSDSSQKYWDVASKGTVGVGVTLGFASGANHIYGIIGWNSIGMQIKPRGGKMYVNETPTSDDQATVAVKGVSGSVSGVTFGLGFDRQITKVFSLGCRVMVLNSGGSKALRLAPANYYPNDAEFNTPTVTVRPFVSTFMVVLKYMFMPKRK